MSIKTYGSLFAGVGGIDIGLDSADLQCKFQVEWDPNCQQTLAYHWPTVPRWGDISTVNGFDLPQVDVITFGSPCQDLSVAGKRAGLDGDRSSLFFEATRIIKQMKEKTNGEYPKIAIWENVTGALTSNNGDDFETVLKEMVELGSYHLEWAVLDAQYFGVPQRRRRVFVIAILDSSIAKRCGSQILAVGQSSRGSTKKSKTPLKNSSPSTGEGTAGAGPNTSFSTKCELINLEQSERTTAKVVGTLSARDFKGVGNQYVQEHKLIIEPIIGFSHTQGLDPQASLNVWPTLRKEGGGHAVNIDKVVRRLTPIECERLMGWPDNHTLYRADGKTNSDSARYKMCGNGVASPVIKWIADQIKEI